MLYWKKMPSLWIGNRIAEFSDLDTAKAIAALKIYLTFCLFCKESDSGHRTVELTFSNLCEMASLSRSLVNEGLKILYAKELIKNISPTARKKIYTVDVLENHDDGWCKLPFKGVVDEDKKISAFQSMHNRYPFELLALQTYMYLLYARDNNSEYTLAREGANKRGNSSRLTQSFHFFMFEPIFFSRKCLESAYLDRFFAI